MVVWISLWKLLFIKGYFFLHLQGLFMKSFCYANVVMINWLKYYIIFVIIYLASVCNRWYKQSVQNLKCNLITCHKTTVVTISSNQQPWKLFSVSSENVYMFFKVVKWNILKDFKEITLWKPRLFFKLKKMCKVFEMFKLLLNTIHRTGRENIISRLFIIYLLCRKENC